MKFNRIILAIIIFCSVHYLQAQENDLERAKVQAKWLVGKAESEANKKLPQVLSKCDKCHLGKKLEGDLYLRMDLLRNGKINLEGDAPDINTIKIVSTIPLKTNRGRLSWIKKVKVDLIVDEVEDEWKEHKDFDSVFDILVESTIVANEEGIFKSTSKATYKWKRKPYITIDVKLGKIKIGLDEIAGKEIQKAIEKYIKELDRELEKFLNQ